jgi:hypothetical protein
VGPAGKSDKRGILVLCALGEKPITKNEGPAMTAGPSSEERDVFRLLAAAQSAHQTQKAGAEQRHGSRFRNRGGREHRADVRISSAIGRIHRILRGVAGEVDQHLLAERRHGREDLVGHGTRLVCLNLVERQVDDVRVVHRRRCAGCGPDVRRQDRIARAGNGAAAM